MIRDTPLLRRSKVKFVMAQNYVMWTLIRGHASVISVEGTRFTMVRDNLLSLVWQPFVLVL